jgi:hypothetical protein
VSFFSPVSSSLPLSAANKYLVPTYEEICSPQRFAGKKQSDAKHHWFRIVWPFEIVVSFADIVGKLPIPIINAKMKVDVIKNHLI